MGHQSKRSLHQQVYDRLQSMCGYGRSKQTDKALNLTSRYIYSYNTMRTYLKHANLFVRWCKSNPQIQADLGHRPRTLDECEAYVEQFIRDREQAGCSAYTVKMELAALSKMYQKRFSIETKGARRADITRSRRENTSGDRHFSETQNAALVTACRCVGFRRSELEKAQASDLWQAPGGQWFMNIQGKGGKRRAAMLVGTPEEISTAVAYIQGLTGHNHVHSNADIHAYRADYATRIYQTYARPIDSLRGQQIDYTAATGKRNKDGSPIYRSAVYYCRGDQAGRALDRLSMLIASQALGHNRESVVGEHYIRDNV